VWFRPHFVIPARGAGIDNYMQSQSPDPLIGQTIAGKYRVVARLGAGGMGVLYKAINTQLDKPVALKMVHRELLGRGTNLQRLRREASVLASLNHPNIVSVNAIDIDDQGKCLVAMEYLDGVDLDQHLRQSGPLTLDQFKIVFDQVCAALSYAHSRGIIHRDLKPNNLMLLDNKIEDGSVKVIDFGLARLVDQSKSQILTSAGAMIGSVNYMSPEQCQGSKLDQRSDVYSLACVMHETLTGQTPFVAETPFATIFRHTNETLPALSDPKLKALSSVLIACTSIDPDDRLPTVAAMWQAIQSESVITTKRMKAITINWRLAMSAFSVLILFITGLTAHILRQSNVDSLNGVADPKILENEAKDARDSGDLKSFETYAERTSQLATCTADDEEILAADYYKAAQDQPEGSDLRRHLATRMVEHAQKSLERVHGTTSNTGTSPHPSVESTQQVSNHRMLEVLARMQQRLQDLKTLDIPEADTLITDQIEQAKRDDREVDVVWLTMSRGELRFWQCGGLGSSKDKQKAAAAEHDARAGFLAAVQLPCIHTDQGFAEAAGGIAPNLCNYYNSQKNYKEAENIANLWLTVAADPHLSRTTVLVGLQNALTDIRDQARQRLKEQVPNRSSKASAQPDKK
jgi:serine/threonine protein kinase